MPTKNITLQEATALMLGRIDSLEEKLATVNEGYTAPKIVSQVELAEYLDVTVATVIKYDNLGIIPSIRIGSSVRYDLKKVLESLERKKRR